MTEESPKLEPKDWEYVQSETRASSAELSYSKPSKKTDNLDIPQQAKKLLTQSIDKSQKVIDQYPNSKWIDDSYFLIAKSSFIKSDYQYSEKYFRKILNEFPYSKLVIESKLWLAYTFLKNKRFRFPYQSRSSIQALIFPKFSILFQICNKK